MLALFFLSLPRHKILFKILPIIIILVVASERLDRRRWGKKFVHGSVSVSLEKRGSEGEETEIWDHVLIIAHSMSDKIKFFILFRLLLCVELLLAFASPWIYFVYLVTHSIICACDGQQFFNFRQNPQNIFLCVSDNLEILWVELSWIFNKIIIIFNCDQISHFPNCHYQH